MTTNRQWSKGVAQSDAPWKIDPIHDGRQGRDLLVYKGGASGVYINVTADGDVTHGPYDDAISNIGDAVFYRHECPECGNDVCTCPPSLTVDQLVRDGEDIVVLGIVFVGKDSYPVEVVVPEEVLVRLEDLDDDELTERCRVCGKTFPKNDTGTWWRCPSCDVTVPLERGQDMSGPDRDVLMADLADRIANHLDMIVVEGGDVAHLDAIAFDADLDDSTTLRDLVKEWGALYRARLEDLHQNT